MRTTTGRPLTREEHAANAAVINQARADARAAAVEERQQRSEAAIAQINEIGPVAGLDRRSYRDAKREAIRALRGGRR